MRILVVEDDELILEGVCEYIRDMGYECKAAKDGLEALTLFRREEFNLILLDIMLPKLNGLDLLSHIRTTSKIPILMMTAFGDEEYKISAFAHMADGFIEKPFSLPLLGTRIKALLQRYYSNYEVFIYKDCQVDFSAYEATYKGEKVAINPKELEILKYLCQNSDKVLTRAQILDHVWQEKDEIPYDRVIDVYIKELRRKLNLDCIVTVRNVGYMLKKS
ncbi:response regulator transcription factor [Amygdalobacter indicium]|jgi:hypothetical protein|uniref:Stage 0 sporulation protein A homolog n=1 Tax=Amygdalobacter indicium TaxID=3029272 RepID=A0ABY8C6W3_9FIRM|nr:response regulator transcription factor [Amygdalobacter indicium]WEG34103.1 response regulator transcription factor [Amygdalobacter indicium]WEG35674.1 response regulator transcription factor [Amygdalobacter indicium]